MGGREDFQVNLEIILRFGWYVDPSLFALDKAGNELITVIMSPSHGTAPVRPYLNFAFPRHLNGLI